MGQEASVPRGHEEEGGDARQQPQAHASPSNAVDAPPSSPPTAVVSPSVARGGVGLAGGGGLNLSPRAQQYSQQPQSRQQQGTDQIVVGSLTPPHQPQHPSSPPAASPPASLMSRAGITSMFQRMGGGSGRGGLQVATGKAGLKSPETPTQGGAITSPTDSTNGYYTPRGGNFDAIHHQDLSPDSQARQHAMMMKRQQEEEQRQNPQLSTQQSSSSAQTADMSNVTRNGGEASLAQGMAQMSLSGQALQQRKQSPPSPRQELLKKMQNNDEEDWQKAWEEDSESDEEDEEGGVGGGSKPPIVPDLGVPGGPPAPIPYRPDMDGGHSSAAVPALPPRNSAMHSAFATPTPQPRSPGPEAHFIGNQKAIALAGRHGGMHSPVITYADEDARLVQEANEQLRGEDGRQHWDSYAKDQVEEEKPNVEMFDPALRVLGRGSFGRVVLVQKQHGQGTGSLYAMKILRKSHLVRRRQIERTKTERKVLSMLDHPFIMKMYYAFQTTEKLYLVLDYCPGGELFFHLSRYRRFQEPVARFYAAELMLAIGHLHKNGIIYRDLKPENVLLDAYGHVKLGDFGLAKYGIRHPTQGAKSTCGTPEYMAPEVLNQSGHGFCVDYWGLGMILYEMMTGLPPWYTTDRSKLFRRLRSAPLIFPNEVHFTPHCKACIAGLLDREPRMRLGVMGLRSAMRHEFFYRKINFEALRARQIAAPIRPCEGWRQFQSRASSMASDSGSDPQQPGWHGSLDSATMGGITAEALDVATANFDDSFRRMPIETEDYETQQQAAGHPPISEKDLNAGTFRGFTYDGDLPPEGDDQTHHNSPERPPPGGGGLV